MRTPTTNAENIVMTSTPGTLRAEAAPDDLADPEALDVDVTELPPFVSENDPVLRENDAALGDPVTLPPLPPALVAAAVIRG